MNDISYYLKLTTSLYRNKPNFISWLTVLLTPFNDLNKVLDTLYSNFDVDNAVGDQLDIIGELIGQTRTLNFQPTDGSSPTLDDATYQTVLKAKMGLNQWKGQAADIESLWATLFPNGAVIMQDNQDMSITVGVAGISITQTMRDLIREGYIVPRPQGVKMKYFFASKLPMFAYGLDNNYQSGYGKGYWSIGEDDPPLFYYDLDTTKAYDEGTWD